MSRVLEANCDTFVAYKDIEKCIESVKFGESGESVESVKSVKYVESVPSLNILFGILEKFKLNEAIIRPTLRLLCQMQPEARMIDDRLAQALLFYSSTLRNENVRSIAMASLKHLHPGLLTQIPEVIFNLLLDDSDEIRREGCDIVSWLLSSSSARSFNLLYSLRSYVALVGHQIFYDYLRSKRLLPSTVSSPSSLILFEQEPLNEFLDLAWLEYNFF